MLQKLKVVIFVTLLLILVTSLVGCATPTAAPQAPATEQPAASATKETAKTEAPATAPAKKKVFVFGRYMDAITPDPVMNDANADLWYLQQYYSGLMRFTADNKVEPDLADRVEVSKDGLTWTYYLKPNLVFSDGTPITPEDWVWSLKRAADPNNGIWWFTFDAMKDVTADAEKVVFTLKEPYTPFEYTPAMFNAVVMPKAKVEAAGGWEKFMEKPIGAGPFILKEWKRGEYMDLIKNPNYWDAANVTMDEIMIKTIVDDNARILALQAGEVDAINYPPFNRVADLKADPNLQILTFPSTFTTYITLNNREAPLNDVRVRQALSYAIDRQALIDSVNFGVGTPAKGFRAPGTLYYNDQLVGWPLDVEKAKSLLAEAGYPNGFNLTMEIVTGREMHQQIATLVKDMWAKIGVNLTIVPLESGLYNDHYYNNQFQVHINGWTDDIPDPSEGVSYAMVYKTSQCFHTGWHSDEVDKMAADALKLPNGPEREAIYKQLQQIFNDNVPFIPLYHEPYLIIARNNVKNFVQTPLGSYIWRNIEVTK